VTATLWYGGQDESVDISTGLGPPPSPPPSPPPPMSHVARGQCQSLPLEGPIVIKHIRTAAEVEANITHDVSANITVIDDESHDAYAALIVNGVKMTVNPSHARVKDGDKVGLYKLNYVDP
jgi:hypothetical protein